ncbi:MAG: flagellar filament capping protein FliD [Acidobacteriota bacterium]
MVNATNFSGVGSGIDFGVITDAIIAARSRPLRQLTTKQSELRGRADALRQLNTKLIAFKEATSVLTDRTIATGKSTSSSATTVANATASDTAAVGTINLQVVRLASKLTQASRSYTSAQATVLADGATSATFELRKGGASSGTAITIDSTNNTLTGLRDAINGAKAGITASIIDLTGDGSQQQLVLTSAETGAAGRVELVETTSTGTAASINLRTLNPNSGLTSDLNASLKINGLEITRSSNTVSDAVTGVTLNLQSTGSTDITISNNSATLRSKIDSFVGTFNDLQEFINSQFKADAQGKPTGILASDSILRTVQAELRNAVDAAAPTSGGTFSQFSQIGISRNKEGKLAIDQTLFTDKLRNALSDVQALFSGAAEGNSGLANSIDKIGSGLSDNVTSTISGFDASVTRIDKSIAAQQARLNALRTSLSRQFAIADAAIGQLNGQNTALSNVLKSLEPSTKS